MRDLGAAENESDLRLLVELMAAAVGVFQPFARRTDNSHKTFEFCRRFPGDLSAHAARGPIPPKRVSIRHTKRVPKNG